METTIKDYLERVRQAKTMVLQETKKIVAKNEQVITEIVLAQTAENRSHSLGGVRIGSKFFSGNYAPATQSYASSSGAITSKTRGQPYNFMWTGEFIENLKVKMDKNSTSLSVYSSGMGSGEKKAFLSAYSEKLFQLSDKTEKRLNYDVILPELLEFLNQHL